MTKWTERNKLSECGKNTNNTQQVKKRTGRVRTSERAKRCEQKIEVSTLRLITHKNVIWFIWYLDVPFYFGTIFIFCSFLFFWFRFILFLALPPLHAYSLILYYHSSNYMGFKMVVGLTTSLNRIYFSWVFVGFSFMGPIFLE